MLDNSRAQATLEFDDQAGLDPLYYYEILKKRKLYALIPFICVWAIGSAATMLWPPTYQSEGRLLVETQQIPADLVRPTVTTTAQERIATITQRVMTRDNLLKVADKYQMFADQSSKLSRTDMLDLMRANTVIKPVELGIQGQVVTVAVTVGFTDRRADTATKVANELITLFLAEDARNRTNRATETTRFLEQEMKKLQVELATIDEKLIRSRGQVSGGASQLAILKSEYAQKSAVFSQSHPEVKRLKAQIEALEKEGGSSVQAAPAPAPVTGYNAQILDPLVLQRMGVQANLESTSQKLSAARRGESLERDQFSERLEVLEQAVHPQRPIKPNRPKLLALALFAAAAAGFVGIFAIESIDKTIRNSSDLASVTNGQLIVVIPYLATKSELQKKRSRLVYLLGIFVASLLAGLIAIHFLWRPLDELWLILLTRLGL